MRVICIFTRRELDPETLEEKTEKKTKEKKKRSDKTSEHNERVLRSYRMR